MEADRLRLHILGTRGSLPVSGADFSEFGGASTCFLLEYGGQALFLDAGSGILNAPAAVLEGREISILLSHAHIDHILGLPFFAPLSEKGREIRIYGRSRGGLDLEAQLARFLSPPLWPCTLRDYPARIVCQALDGPLTLGALSVETAEAVHPGGCSVFAIRCGEKKLVCASDFEDSGDAAERLAAFAAGAELLLCDAQYTPRELEARRGYGHATAETGLRVQRMSGAKRLLLIHHDPRHTDAMLREWEKRLPETARFAREGDVIEL